MSLLSIEAVGFAYPGAKSPALDGVTGVVEHGLFIGIASVLVIAGPKGVEIINRRPS